MFQIGDYIIYRNTGVCQVVQIGIPENFSILDSDVQYYFLEPLHGSGTVSYTHLYKGTEELISKERQDKQSRGIYNKLYILMML